MPTNVKPGSWSFVRFDQNPKAVIRSGFLSDAFTICAGLIYYNPEAQCCALVHGPPNSPVFKSFYQWLVGAVEPPGTKLILIMPKIKGSKPGAFFEKSVLLMHREQNCTLIMGRDGAPIGKNGDNVKVSCNAQGYQIMKSSGKVLLEGKWK